MKSVVIGNEQMMIIKRHIEEILLSAIIWLKIIVENIKIILVI